MLPEHERSAHESPYCIYRPTAEWLTADFLSCSDLRELQTKINEVLAAYVYAPTSSCLLVPMRVIIEPFFSDDFALFLTAVYVC